MALINEQLVRQVVADVIGEVLGDGPSASRVGEAHPQQAHAPNGLLTSGQPSSQNRTASSSSEWQPGELNRWGLFADVDRAVGAAGEAYEQLSRLKLADRKRITDTIRQICRDDADELGTAEFHETGVGRLDHKIEKLQVLADFVPGVEFLKSQAFSGDFGLTVIEPAPFGVIAAVTPVTHSLPTLAANAINMIAAGNTLVANPHPSGKRIAARGVQRFNQAIAREFQIENLVCAIVEPTIESANQLFGHRDIALICVTGGPGVARAALKSGKRAIVAGPGNPPVVVDETADLSRAARCIIEGASYDNNLLCIGEKQIFVVASVADQLKRELADRGAVELPGPEIEQLTRQAIASNGGHFHAVGQFVGKSASFLAESIGRQVPPNTELLFGETPPEHPMVLAEQMMPFIPLVRCANADEAIEQARISEHGFRHTAIIHSNSVRNMTRMGQMLDTTIFVKNGPCTAGNGINGEGWFSYSIAGPTGEGVTTPLTFTRQRRCAMIDNLRIIGKPEA